MLPGYTHAQRAGQEETALEGAGGDALADRENIHDLDNLPSTRSPRTFEDDGERIQLTRRSSASADGGTSTTHSLPFDAGVSPIPVYIPEGTERSSRDVGRTIGAGAESHDYVPGVRGMSPATTLRPIHSRARVDGGVDSVGAPATQAAALGNARTPYRETIKNALGVGDLTGDYGNLETRTHPSVIVPPRTGLSGKDTKISDLLSASVSTINTSVQRGFRSLVEWTRTPSRPGRAAERTAAITTVSREGMRISPPGHVASVRASTLSARVTHRTALIGQLDDIVKDISDIDDVILPQPESVRGGGEQSVIHGHLSLTRTGLEGLRVSLVV